MSALVDAVIFDMDGLLIDSEPLWRTVEVAVLRSAGLSLVEKDCEATTGLRIDEVTAFWHQRQPLQGLSSEEAAARIVDEMVARAPQEARALPGAAAAVQAARDAGLKVALCSSSPLRLIEACVRALGLAGAFDVTVSAENESHGKPHPAVYLTTAARLGVPGANCVAVEDSLNGVIAAKAARMACVAVPQLSGGDPALARFGVADVVLPSLLVFPSWLWTRVADSR